MEYINSIFSGIMLPALLIGCGIYLGFKLRFFYVFHPFQAARLLGERCEEGGVSPFRALSMALAGTLGVGNMAGVATAISAGGAGALFWMWVSALCAMSIKYFEVRLALETREGKKGERKGGAMFYISRLFGGKGKRLAILFAMLCAANSLLTGNIVQVNSACAALGSIDPLFIGVPMGILAAWIAAGGGKRALSATSLLIPLLSGIYMILCLAVIFSNAGRLPSILYEIITDAFSLSSVGGGIGGFAVTRAVRFGVTRGIFSNEAGCGTSPTAHAMAETKSPHHSGCFGIFEVFADTMVLCTMTGIVILMSDMPKLDGIPLTLYAFRSLAGPWASDIISLSVILFALSTLMSQSTYGLIAIEFTGLPYIKVIYLLLIFASSVCGSLISSAIMWQLADLIISLMTFINTFSVIKYTIEHPKGFPIRSVVPQFQRSV